LLVRTYEEDSDAQQILRNCVKMPSDRPGHP